MSMFSVPFSKAFGTGNGAGPGRSSTCGCANTAAACSKPRRNGGLGDYVSSFGIVRSKQLMKNVLRLPILLAVLCLGLGTVALLLAQEQGPQSDSSETVAKPRRPATENGEPAPPPEEQKIPSEFKKQKEVAPEATFRSDVNTVTVDVAVLDSKGHFIPNIPGGNFRVLEDNVPQKIASFSKGEAPMTVCMLVEFSNRFQQYWSSTWYQTLTAAYGFAQTLKPEDYIAVVAYDMKPEILSDFSTDRQKTYEALSRLRIPGFSEANLRSE